MLMFKGIKMVSSAWHHLVLHLPSYNYPLPDINMQIFSPSELPPFSHLCPPVSSAVLHN